MKYRIVVHSSCPLVYFTTNVEGECLPRIGEVLHFGPTVGIRTKVRDIDHIYGFRRPEEGETHKMQEEPVLHVHLKDRDFEKFERAFGNDGAWENHNEL